MINSMTGFGRCELVRDEKKIIVEIKSVNHKYSDVSIKMPRKFNQFETNIRNYLREYASRGKMDIYVSYEDMGEGSASLKFNPELAKEYYGYFEQIKDMFGLDDDIHTSTIAKSPDVLTLQENEINEEELWSILKDALTGAFTMFRDARTKEGESLKNDIFTKLDTMENITALIESKLPSIITEYKAKLIDRFHQLLDDDQIDEGRIAAEVTMYADKIAIDEELVRLCTHIKHMRDLLNKGGEVGRNLDFIAQEMNRESNTILSKSNDIEVTNCGIELKTCIEKIREQVQNIE